MFGTLGLEGHVNNVPIMQLIIKLFQKSNEVFGTAFLLRVLIRPHMLRKNYYEPCRFPNVDMSELGKRECQEESGQSKSKSVKVGEAGCRGSGLDRE